MRNAFEAIYVFSMILIPFLFPISLFFLFLFCRVDFAHNWVDTTDNAIKKSWQFMLQSKRMDINSNIQWSPLHTEIDKQPPDINSMHRAAAAATVVVHRYIDVQLHTGYTENAQRSVRPIRFASAHVYRIQLSIICLHASMHS